MTFDEETEKVTVQHRSENLFSVEPETMSFDYAVVAIPFSRVRLWNPMPDYTSLLSRAIDRLNYSPSCKVALHYETRFWEHLEHPIIGGCGTVDIPGIRNVCYPSYQLNSTGPGVLLASYESGVPARSLGALTEEQHVALVQRAMIESPRRGRAGAVHRRLRPHLLGAQRVPGRSLGVAYCGAAADVSACVLPH